ncbi:DUF3348 domain-containing protein [Pseudoxanthomonas sp. UTMC 1351]|uniref:DUF3348 domain-containing protein n=1 Tax=Pseudoxanthomonas sp. UTMC 1351 TaxID=2695853 RepID=UPI0034CDD794
MAKAPPRTPVSSPVFIRLLARLTDVDVPQSHHVLSDRLSQWIDWTRAVALSRALDGTVAAAAVDAPGSFDSAMEDEVVRGRVSLTNAITGDRELSSAERRGNEPDRVEESSANTVADYAFFQQRYLAMQRAMLAATGRLRGRLRDMLVQKSADMARLAEVDAVMELALSPREQTLLAAVPKLLGEHFERLQQAEQASLADASLSERAPAVMPGEWLRVFRQDMQSVLLAELDVRFQPIEGLLAALRTP